MRKTYFFAASAISAMILASAANGQIRDGQSNWKIVTTADGSMYQVDLNSIIHGGDGTAEIIVSLGQRPGYPAELHRIRFDCRGRFQDITFPTFSPSEAIVAGSLAAVSSDLACKGAQDARFDKSPPQAAAGSPAEYCAGFSSAACARIVAVVSLRQKPSYCTSGFARVENGLSNEQLRICFVMTADEFRAQGYRGR